MFIKIIRGKYFLPNPVNQKRRIYCCCSSRSPDPTTAKAEDVLPAGAWTEHMYMPYINVYT